MDLIRVINVVILIVIFVMVASAVWQGRALYVSCSVSGLVEMCLELASKR